VPGILKNNKNNYENMYIFNTIIKINQLFRPPVMKVLDNTAALTIKKNALQVIKDEISALEALFDRIDDSFYEACNTILNCKGKVIILGMGKSGHVGNKIAATFASTGTPAVFIHPAEACHGDIGIVTKQDVILAISYSGNANEIMQLIPFITRMGAPLIVMTGNKHAALAKHAHTVLDIAVAHEACPLGLAPTSSTTVTMVLGDALALSILTQRGFSKNDFAMTHPCGQLGRRLILKNKDIMRIAATIPLVNETATLKEALLEMTNKKLGVTGIIDAKTKELVGIFTDGDLRRSLEEGININTTIIADIMTKNCRTTTLETATFETFTILEQHKITSLFVVNELSQPIGIIHMHDLISAGIA
jgi:arabinose-5-phosphate isomerase